MQIDCSIPLTVDDYHLLQPWPKEESRLTACIRPFSWAVTFKFSLNYINNCVIFFLIKVWLLFLFSVIAIIVFMALLTHYYHQWGTERISISFMDDIYHHTMYALTVICGQGNIASTLYQFGMKLLFDPFPKGNNISPKTKFSLRLVAGLWCLMMVVLVNAYTGTLMSYLTVPKLRPIVNTLEELAASSETQMTVDFELGKARMFLVINQRKVCFNNLPILKALESFIQEATSGPNKVIGNSLRNNPQLLVKGSSTEGVKNVLQRGSVYFAVCGCIIVIHKKAFKT